MGLSAAAAAAVSTFFGPVSLSRHHRSLARSPARARALRNHGLPTTAACRRRRLRQARGSERDVGSQEKQGVARQLILYS